MRTLHTGQLKKAQAGVRSMPSGFLKVLDFLQLGNNSMFSPFPPAPGFTSFFQSYLNAFLKETKESEEN